MSRVIGLFLVFFFSVLNVQAFDSEDHRDEHDYEHILHFHSEIFIQKDGKVRILETIDVLAQGFNIKRGIFRDIPLWYDLEDGGSYHVGFNLINVKRDGEDEDHHTEWLDNGIRVYAGNKDRFISTGVHRYTIEYLVEHVILFNDKSDEFVWNVNGNGWMFSVDTISASIHLPNSAKALNYAGYVGSYGSIDRGCYKDEIDGSVFFGTLAPLSSGEGLTIAVAFEKNKIVYPTAWEKAIFFMQTYSQWFVAGIGLVLGLGISLLLWILYGIDPKPGTIIPRFYAPDGFSPAECAYLNKAAKSTDTMLSSMFVSLASKGLITIEYKVSGGKKVYVINKTEVKPDEAKLPLTEMEELMYRRLLQNRDQIKIVEDKYNAKVSSFSDLLKQKIEEKQVPLYVKRNRKISLSLFVMPVLMILIGLLCHHMFGGALIIVVIGSVLMLAGNFLFRYLLEQPTKLGRQKMDEIAGFIMYMKYADSDRIKALNPPDFSFQHFEQNLAYAIALGVASEWSRSFRFLHPEASDDSSFLPPYFLGMSYLHLSSMGSSMSQTISSAATPPSASSSGGSSFSGGGGFSGGGFGGGGGGGW